MHPSRRLCLTAMFVVAAFFTTALPVAASCEDSVAGCGLDHDQTDVRPVTVTQISALVNLRTDNEGLSHSLYRDLLPPQYGMPLVPTVGVSLTQTDEPGGALGAARGSRIDGAIALRAVMDGDEGWYPLAQPTTAGNTVDSGRAAGLPRSQAKASLKPAGESWAGVVTVADVQRMSLLWTGGDAALRAGAADIDWAQRRQPFYGVSPVVTGWDRTRVKETFKAPVPLAGAGVPVPGVDGVTALSEATAGTVSLTFDPDINGYDDDSAQLPNLGFGEGQSLADLIPSETTVPGLLWQTDALRITHTDYLDDGQDGPLPQPEACSRVVAGPAASATSFATPVVVVAEGGCVEFTNVEEMQHDVTAVDRDGAQQPLFASAYTSAGATNRVVGVEDVPPGDYQFACSLHGAMSGTLKVVDNPTAPTGSGEVLQRR